jgi:hypothetical protein
MFCPIPLADADVGGIVTLVIVVLGGVLWLLRRLGESQTGSSQQQRPQQQDEGYQAGEEQVRRFFESIGVQTARPTPLPASGSGQPAKPAARPGKRQPQRPAAEPAATSAPVMSEKHMDELAKSLERAESMQARKAKAHIEAVVDRLSFPQLTPLQRAIVLSEIVSRRRGPHRPVTLQ